MPIYEYKCNKCAKEFEVLVLGSRDDVRCPQCDAADVSRLMSGFAHKNEGGTLVSSSGGGCSSCSGGSCSTCH
ncbi:regulatory protein, FmdB family [Desulfarculus baarsii DSM 2075]|uniref:Regulatory protein, FmdB family n=1 Tax=Desulfarculus baarsii (strain ATCC 33931 / DSM 2075 / LMG 7858 / VKM B-1802 / 2st14) TaxID=644282 RepID=E1QF48_DESB2|nr:zinc ribbon domain-containing protein [Desulfarculus baarsii]ADK84184.1 regulatory protein, FmdB family [Desulfarculus baarsii DSM 2075]